METQTEKKVTYFAIPGVKKDKGILTNKKILYEVCKYLGLSYDIAQTKYKKREYVKARQYSHYLAKQFFHALSFQVIGDDIGRKDHATVMHSCKTIGYDLENYRETRREIQEIKQIIIMNYEI